MACRFRIRERIDVVGGDKGVCGEEQLLAAVRSEVAAVNGEMNNALRVGGAVDKRGINEG